MEKLENGMRVRNLKTGEVGHCSYTTLGWVVHIKKSEGYHYRTSPEHASDFKRNWQEE